MADHTPEQIAEMERVVAEYRGRELRAAQRHAYATAAPFRDLIANGTLQAVQDAATAIFTMAGDSPAFANMRASANAIRIGLANLAPAVAALPDGAEPAPEPPADEDAA